MANNPNFPSDFLWSNNGLPNQTEYDCIKIYDTEVINSWDNYFCWLANLTDPSMQWSNDGPIVEMRCTHISETVDPESWVNNYLCVPEDSSLNFSWSSTNAVEGESCIQWDEENDFNYSWSNSWLCDDPTYEASNTTNLEEPSNAGVAVGMTVLMLQVGGLVAAAALSYFILKRMWKTCQKKKRIKRRALKVSMSSRYDERELARKMMISSRSRLSQISDTLEIDLEEKNERTDKRVMWREGYNDQFTVSMTEEYHRKRKVDLDNQGQDI